MRYLLSSIIVLLSSVTAALAADISVVPQTVIQGEPVMVVFGGTSVTSTISKLIFDGVKVPVFLYQNKPTALIAIDLYKPAGDYKLIATLSNGKTVEKVITVGKREKKQEPLGIPEKLGGNTPAAQTALVTTLVQENKVLNSLWTGLKAFWTVPFRYPLASTSITDPYGYSRITGQYTIAHKGVDFRADEGTKVYAMNRGVVRLARTFRNYGKTIVVDHGLGIQTMYMHLSKIKVNAGELVKPGQVIGFSGQTGYAEQPHLHISVRINGISIDPIKFLDLFQ